MRSMRTACSGLPAHHQQAVPVERTEASLAQVGGEDVQYRAFRQLEQAGVSVEVLLVVVFQQPRRRQLAIREPQQPARPEQGEAQGKAAGNPIADIEAHERDQLGRRRVELAGRAVVAVPVEHQVGGEDAAAGHRGDVGHEEMPRRGGSGPGQVMSTPKPPPEASPNLFMMELQRSPSPGPCSRRNVASVCSRRYGKRYQKVGLPDSV